MCTQLCCSIPFLKYLWILWQYFISNIDSQSLLKKTGLIEKILSLKKTITSILWTFRLVIWFVAKLDPSFIKDTMTHIYAALITSQGPIFISCEIGLQRSTKKSNLKNIQNYVFSFGTLYRMENFFTKDRVGTKNEAISKSH